MLITIIIPVYNEEKNIGKLIDYLNQIIDYKLVSDIIVVDGGSTDKTLAVLQNYPEIKIINSLKGRSVQMNTGAKASKGNILYFLHCDTFPPLNFDQLIVNEVKKGSLCGSFKMKFDSNHIVLIVSQWFTRFNFKCCRGGDQSLFVEKELFQRLNGFNQNLTIYEDNEFISRLYKTSKFTVIQKSVTTSARRYKLNGTWNLQFHFFIIHVMNSLGYNQDQLKKYYSKNIKS